MHNTDHLEVELGEPRQALARKGDVLERDREFQAELVHAGIGGEEHTAMPPPEEGDLARAVSGRVHGYEVGEERWAIAVLDELVNLSGFDSGDKPEQQPGDNPVA